MEQQKSHSLAERIIKASVIVGLAHILLKFAGLIQVKFATQFLDSSLYEPIMVVAFAGVVNTLFLVGEEVIGPTFLTLFIREKEEHGEKAAWDYTNAVLTFQTLLLVLLTLSIICFPDAYIALLTNWNPQTNPERYRLLRLGLQVLAPSLIFLSLGSTTYVLLNGYKKFFLAAFGDAATKICIVIGLLIGMGLFGLSYQALFAGILLGSAAKLLTHLYGVRDKLHYLRPSLNWRNPVFRRMLILMLPLLAGIIFAKFRDLFNNIYVLTRLRQDGVLMANDLGRRLYSSIQWLVPYALQIALFPFLCDLVSKNDRHKLGEVLGGSTRLLLAVFIPGAACLAILAIPLSVLIFMGGKTGVALAYWAGISTACYILVLPAAAVECVLMQGFFADRKTVAVTVIGILSSFLSVVLSYVAVVHFALSPEASLVAVALGFVLSRCLKSCTLAWYLQRSTPMFEWRDMSRFTGKMLLLTLAVALVSWGASHGMATLLPDGIAASRAGLPGAKVVRSYIVLRLAVAGSAAAIAFMAGAWLLQLKEARQMFDWTAGKFLAKINRKTGRTAGRPD